ncbi:hypothetical protein CDL12_00605 [Handroanthus impetiginosus]|uniref:Uncharacterized protein n=1 Tax=Handroanthus impetiginosus TaxID=429701 RepID=A0A2G9IA41_9LAMI|nr:hypothetical protein CDL12_00605 [Handroanthus impetiginosus]
MANSHRGLYRVKVMRMVLILVGLFFIYYVERNAHKYSIATATSSCPSRSRDCVLEPTISLPQEVINSSLGDCGKDDPETNNEMKKDISLQRTKALIMGAERTSSHYQKEAEKCNARMETYEEARERAEVALIEEQKLTTLWMSGAREYGWKDNTSDYQ